MAAVTFRLAWSNLAALSASVVSSSSEQAAFPDHKVQVPGMSSGWRSAYGWTVVAGFNDKIDFVEGGVAKVGTVTPGEYATGALYATAVQTAMNAAAATNTYTVTYSTTTHKFTVARATGAATIALPWTTGTNVGTAVSSDLGFTADDTGNTTYNGDAEAYVSKQFLILDCVTPQTAGSVHLFGMTTFEAGAAVTVQGNATDAWSSPSLNMSASLGSDMASAWFTPAAYRYWRVVIKDVSNPIGYLGVKALSVAPYLELSRGVQRGYGRQPADTSTVVATSGGGMVQSKRVAPVVLALGFRKLTRTEMLALEQIQTSHGVGRPMVVALDPQNFPEQTMYMALTQALRFQHSHGDGTPPERWSTTLDLMQVTG
jgi:hypothetical protein